jgi:hypothetical protein
MASEEEALDNLDGCIVPKNEVKTVAEESQAGEDVHATAQDDEGDKDQAKTAVDETWDASKHGECPVEPSESANDQGKAVMEESSSMTDSETIGQEEGTQDQETTAKEEGPDAHFVLPKKNHPWNPLLEKLRSNAEKEPSFRVPRR